PSCQVVFSPSNGTNVSAARAASGFQKPTEKTPNANKTRGVENANFMLPRRMSVARPEVNQAARSCLVIDRPGKDCLGRSAITFCNPRFRAPRAQTDATKSFTTTY